jgi:hypothetical protein
MTCSSFDPAMVAAAPLNVAASYPDKNSDYNKKHTIYVRY